MKPNQVLCLADTRLVSFFKQALPMDRFDVQGVVDSAEALTKITREGPYQVILYDQAFIGRELSDLCGQIHHLSPDTMQMLVLESASSIDSVRRLIEQHLIREVLYQPLDESVTRNMFTHMIDCYDSSLAVKRLHADLAAAQQEIKSQNLLFAEEVLAAEKIVANVEARNRHHISGFYCKFGISGRRVGNDIVLSYLHTSGSLHIMQAHITGSDLTSALVALLVADLFEVLTLKNFLVEEIAQGINEKLSNTLPTDVFCAATLIRLDIYHHTVNIWQGGYPSGYFLDKQGNIVRVVQSENVPLGILNGQNYFASAFKLAEQDLSGFFICNRDIPELCNESGEKFGEVRLANFFSQSTQYPDLIEAFLDQLIAFGCYHQQCEAMTLIYLDFAEIENTLSSDLAL